YLWPAAEVAEALWFRDREWDTFPSGCQAACELPDGTRASITVKKNLRSRASFLATLPLLAAGSKLRTWLRDEGASAGDSLLVRITDAARPACRLALERLAERDTERVAARNVALADAAEKVLRYEVRGRPLSASDLAGWLLARGVYRDDCPPDPSALVLA